MRLQKTNLFLYALPGNQKCNQKNLHLVYFFKQAIPDEKQALYLTPV